MTTPLFDIIEGLRLLKTHASADGKKSAKVYRDAEWGEYRVKHYTDGQHHVDGDYHTDDQEDAHATAQHWLNEEVIEGEVDERSGYPAPRDPKMLPDKPGAAARFVAKHMINRKSRRFTDIDKSTLDDNLFSAKNLKRSVPEGEDTHGHTPTGQDAKVYESAKTRPQTPGEKVKKLNVVQEAIDKKAQKAKGSPEDQETQIEAYHDKTLTRHEDAIKRSRAEAFHVGWQQDFGADKSCIVSKTNKGALTTEHDHKSGAIKHTWAEEGKK